MVELIKGKKRTSSTIPFGYELSNDKKLLIPIKSQIDKLNEIKILILKGELSLRAAAEKLKKTTKRKISHVGLRRILDNEYPLWKDTIKSEKAKIQLQSRKVKEFRIKKDQEQKKIEKEKRKKENYLKMLDKQKIYRKENKEKIRIAQLRYQKKNEQKLKKYREEYYEKNKEKYKEYSKEYWSKNALKRKKYYLMQDNDIKKKKKELW